MPIISSFAACVALATSTKSTSVQTFVGPPSVKTVKQYQRAGGNWIPKSKQDHEDFQVEFSEGMVEEIQEEIAHTTACLKLCEASTQPKFQQCVPLLRQGLADSEAHLKFWMKEAMKAHKRGR